jgi:uncharacterized repeat protein (TIGR01451 family)
VVNASLANFPDQTIDATFFPAGTTPDPNNANNSKTATTTVDSPQIDLALTVTDSPDPVFPDGTITYTVTVGNNGPDTATGVSFNVFNNGSLSFQSATVPAGWTCTLPAVNATPTFTCTRPSFAAGSDVFTIVVQATDEVIGINDTTLSTFFGINGTGNETANGNNSETESTAYVTPDADLSVTATDSPDPVTPDNDITYTITVTNSGPDSAANAQLSVFNNGSLSFQSMTVPAGWNCTLPAVNATPVFSCTNPTLASGANSVFTLVVRASSAVIGVNDTTLSTAFSVSSSISDPDPTDNSVTVQTSYVTPDADLSVSVTDSPDPVAPDGNITYTVTVTNGGPDTATNATLNVFNNGTLRFQSATVPAGWTCTLPAVDATATFSCSNPSLASGASSIFTIVVRASSAVIGNSDTTVSTAFSVSSGIADPDPADNSETEMTAYLAPDADLSITASDSPDPVTKGSNITYVGTVVNAGPDAATNAVITIPLAPELLFQSLVAPAGFTCTTPAVGANGLITCTIATLTNGSNLPFTLVVTVDPALAPGGGTINQPFTVASGTADPVPGNNSITVATTWIDPTADLTIAKTTATTSAKAGTTLSYTIVATNNGPDSAVNVSVADTLPSSLLFQSITAPAGFTCTTPPVGASGTITCTALTLANGASASFTLAVGIAPGATGSIVNSASTTSATTDPNGGNNAASAEPVTVEPNVAALAISKTTVATNATTGDGITYTITVTNSGPDSATNVTVTDTLPSGLAFVSATPSQGTCNGASPVSCTLGTIASGGSATITLVASVTATSGTISNTATVSATESAVSPSSSTPPIPVLAPGEIPTLSEWALLLLAAMVAAIALMRIKG